MHPEDYRALANASWWKVWLHRKRSEAIRTLLDRSIEARAELNTLQFVKTWEDRAKGDVISFLAKQIK